jgi:hypothetical protein
MAHGMEKTRTLNDEGCGTRGHIGAIRYSRRELGSERFLGDLRLR